MKIQPEVFAALSQCKYKALLLAEGEPPPEDQPEIVQAYGRERAFRKRRWLESLEPGLVVGEVTLASCAELRKISPAAYGSLTLRAGELCGEVDGLEADKRGGLFPLIVAMGSKPGEEERARLAVAARILEGLGMPYPGRGIVVAEGSRRAFVPLSTVDKSLEESSEKLARLREEGREKLFFLNRHCGGCAYSRSCREKAFQADHLSLLQGMPEREARRQNARGIFTVNQLSHTFQPRRERKSAPPKANHALRALALREKKTYVVRRPQVPEAGTHAYFDVEGSENFFISSACWW
jgi:hypothetical protein